MESKASSQLGEIHSNPELWKEIKEKYLEGNVGGRPGLWSARKAQLSVLEYRRRGGGYTGGLTPAALSLKKWTAQDWRTKSGKPSLETGERYLPAKAIKALSPAQYGATSRAKREGLKKGEAVTDQPSKIAEIVRRFRT